MLSQHHIDAVCAAVRSEQPNVNSDDVEAWLEEVAMWIEFFQLLRAGEFQEVARHFFLQEQSEASQRITVEETAKAKAEAAPKKDSEPVPQFEGAPTLYRAWLLSPNSGPRSTPKHFALARKANRANSRAGSKRRLAAKRRRNAA